MLSLHAFIVIIASISLSSTAVAQTAPIPRYGWCGGVVLGDGPDLPCADGLQCVALNKYFHECLPPPVTATTSSA
ncbi:hypothetical protein FRC05_001498 [Tulasnella sp. 425]|nr:hypothetical protein FRC05_001498 [Tulasnella sp. 425]